MKIEIGRGRTALSYNVTRHGKDLHIHIDGGVSHLGAVTAATPGTCETVVFPQHKEGHLTESLAKALANARQCHVLVSAGVHLDDITAEEIRVILKQNEEIVKTILDALGSHSDAN